VNKIYTYILRIGDAVDGIEIKSKTARKKYLQNAEKFLKSVCNFLK